ncbi:MAG: hypothetical protein H7842_06055 [Gammaproteobacteria bacterium SHHR-1]|uniref:hypothetical protein n=1 Tax=Magnetovirga frankeli TaxID=947516 RepID=UPI00129357BC|nr:hypothetical protein D5125_01155 [gamma proteobacterium SS-5]
MRYLLLLISLLSPGLALAADKPLAFGDWAMLDASKGRFVALTGNGPARLALQFHAQLGCKPMLRVSAPGVSEKTQAFAIKIGEASFNQALQKPLSKALLEAMRKGKSAELQLGNKAVPFSLTGSNAATETAAARCRIDSITFAAGPS